MAWRGSIDRCIGLALSIEPRSQATGAGATGSADWRVVTLGVRPSVEVHLQSFVCFCDIIVPCYMAIHEIIEIYRENSV